MATNTTIQVVAPGAGESVTEGEILEWHVQEGDRIALDETIVEISTDKVDVEVPSPAAGVVVQLHAEEGETISVGQLLAEIQPTDDATPSVAAATAADVDTAAGSRQPDGSIPVDPPGTGTAPTATGNVDAEGDLAHDPAATEAAQDTAAGELLDIVSPGAGESVTEGDILEWHVQVGDVVVADQTVVEISTDKVDVEVPAPTAGAITEILAPEGATIKVGQVIARMRVGEGVVPVDPGGNGASAPPKAPTRAPDPSGGGGDGDGQIPPPAPGDPLAPSTKISPVAARVAAVHGVDVARLAGSGPGGRITKADVLAAGPDTRGPADGGSVAVAAPAQARPIKGAGAMLARYMDQSRAIPTATSLRTITVTVMDERRRELKTAGQKVSFTHLIAYAIALAATQDMPVMAHHFDTIEGRPHRLDDGGVNLGIAVDVTGRKGERTLMVPVIRDAGRLSFAGFKAAFDTLIEKARTNALTTDDLQGANISLTNPGGIGTVASVPRLMVGQGTIIATGSIAYPVGLGHIGGAIGAEKVMTMTSTYDHRIIQGAESGQFLKTVEEYLQGEHDFYEGIFGSLDLPLRAAPALPTGVAAISGSAGRDPVPAREDLPSAPPADAAVSSAVAEEELMQAVQAAVSLVKAHRTHGHLAARLDPLGSEPEGDPALKPEPLGLTPELMARIPARILRVHVPGATLADALPQLTQTYCGTIAYEIEHIASHRQRVWLRERIESGTFRNPLSADEQQALLTRLIEVDALERFMHKAYLGQKQFSIEGLDMTIPMIDEMIQLAAAQGAREVVLGMAHRGRLNVLAHNLGRPYESIFAEFEGASTLQAITTIPQGGTGDVKYHHGAQGSYQLPDGSSILVNLESNPSHLEFVHPVVAGASRAAQTTREGPHARRDTSAAVPIVLHGDAAFPGQGVVAESLNLQALDGYQVGGTLHIITNNQVGFTTDPEDARSTRWASDLAKGFDVPIIHVNADDVAACLSAVRLAFAFRQEFGHDVLIDLIGYRRFGHNEADEPAYTQPEMTAVIKSKERVCVLFARKLVDDGVVTDDEVQQATAAVWDELTRLHADLKAQIKNAAASGSPSQQTGEYTLDRTPSPEVKTAVSSERLLSLNRDLLSVPDGFAVHPKLVKQLERRRNAVGADGGIDWAHAEALAFASLLTEGIPIRLTGQDVQRGTFSHRHMVLHDANNGQAVSPIQNLPGALAPLELHNSPLSEAACLGFEYGYSQEAPETLVLWEAQFGDFANGAQVIIDQFIVSGLAKWGQSSRLTLLLPHGYEGSGPEHSSARLERFLQLAAEGNIRVANVTTPAQYFHLLRRQARIAKQRPLIVMQPKSLLRLPQATNRIEHLSETQFFRVLGEPRVPIDKVTRLVLCTGKVYYDLVGHPDRQDNERIAVGRVELLYPFPEGQILELINTYPNLKEVLWVQEEPRNKGARAHMAPRLMQILPEHLAFGYVGRPERASTGEGYPAAHNMEQNRIITTALDLSIPVRLYPTKTPGER